MKLTCKSLRRNRKAISPAFSTMILTAGVIVMILVAMTYASNILNQKLAENEFSSNQQGMQTTGQQLDDIAWTVGRTQTVTYSSRFGAVKFENLALCYNISVHTSAGWDSQTVSAQTGIILFNMPLSAYKMVDGYFTRLPSTANGSFLLSESSAPISQVFCLQKAGMSYGSYLQIALVPTMRVLTSTVGNQSYLKFYVPSLTSGECPYRTQSLTLTGEGISKITRGGVDQVIVTASFPKGASGFDASFFKFSNTTVTLNSASTPRLPAGSVVDFYVGNVQVSIGAA
jgi:hypothetical protein